MTVRQNESDIVIVGGGYVGLSIALATKVAASDLSITVLDAADKFAIEKETRAFAVTAAARRMLKQLNTWQKFSACAQPINEMIVTDSRLHNVTRPVFLTFSRENESEAFAYMVRSRDLIMGLRDEATDNGVLCHYNSNVENCQINSMRASVITACGSQYNAKLLIAADGVQSELRASSGIKTIRWPYNQTGIVVTIAHERPHRGIAQEHFLPAGPFAILPLTGNQSSLVWTESERDARRILSMNDSGLKLELEQRFGHKLGKLGIRGGCKSFPLGLTLAREFVKNRFALAGDAAHGIHPVAGQGLNLGFMDAAALSQSVVEAYRLGLDIGSLNVLENYQCWRRFDTLKMGIFTDLINRLFSNESSLLRFVRDFGLGVVDHSPVLKTCIIKQAAGLKRSTPNLLQGKAI